MKFKIGDRVRVIDSNHPRFRAEYTITAISEDIDRDVTYVGHVGDSRISLFGFRLALADPLIGIGLSNEEINILKTLNDEV